ncbi:MAG: altronate dehydratase family protein, partial [Eubacterium sp.]|nr:altronate dehydratase family protein [Eubacterium sp.]
MELMLIHPDDNVKVNLDNGHKYAAYNIRKGENIIKYGYPIGVAKEDIEVGEHIHSHNLKTALSGEKEYTYTPLFHNFIEETPITISAYQRKNGDIGIRNDIWLIPT